MTDTKVAKTRSIPQNRLYWALLQEAEKRLPNENGELFSRDIWHKYMVLKILGMQEIKLPSGEVVYIPHETHNLPMFPPKENPDCKLNWQYLYMNTEVFMAERGIYLEG